MNLIRPFLLTSLTLLTAVAQAQSTTNTPPTPGNNSPPVTCQTGQLPGSCNSGHGYLLTGCPNIRIETNGGVDAGSAILPPFTQYMCADNWTPVSPYILCWKYTNHIECEGYPSGTNYLTFSWNIQGTILTPMTSDNRRVQIECKNGWAGRIYLYVFNDVSKQLTADFANVACPVPANSQTR